MPGIDPFLNYVNDTREKVDLRKALDNRKVEVNAMEEMFRAPLAGTPLEQPEIPEPPPGVTDEGDFGAHRATRKYWNPNGGISDAPTLGPSISALGKGALDVVPSHVAAKYTMSGKRVGSTEEASFFEAAQKGIESIPGLAKESLAGLLRFTGDVGIAGGGIEGVPGANREEGANDPNWQAQVTGQEMFRRGAADVEKTLPDVEPGTLKAHVYGAVQSLGLSGTAMATGVLSGSTMPLIALAGFSGAQEFGAQREGGSDVPTAILGAVVNGLAEYWGERLPFEAYMRSPGFFTKAIKGALFDTAGELGTQAVQSAVQKLTYQPGMTWDDFAVAMKDTFIQSLMAGGVQGVAIGGAQAATAKTDIGATNLKEYVEQNFQGSKVDLTGHGANVTLPSGRVVEIHTADSPMVEELQKSVEEGAKKKGIDTKETAISGVYFRSGLLVGTENDLIYLTGQMTDPTTLPHEKGHLIVEIMRDMMTPQELEAIGIPARGAISPDLEESVMTTFEEYAYKRTPSLTNPMSPLDKAYQNVIDFAHEIYTAFGGATTQRQVFEQMRTGKILAREGAVRLPGESEAAFQVRTIRPPWHGDDVKTASGRVIGAPGSHQSPQAREGLIRRMVKVATQMHQVDPEQGQWYEKSGEDVRRLFGLTQDKDGNWQGNIEGADQFLRAVAAWSPQADVGRNTDDAINALHQIARGDSPETSGAMTNAREMARRFVEISGAEEVTGDLAGLGPKATSFYWDLHNATFKVRDAVNTTLDRHIIGAFDLASRTGRPMAALNPTQYRWANNVMIEITKRFNEANKTDLDPRNVQAMIWAWQRGGRVAQKGLVDNLGRHLGTGIVTGEIVPATNSDVDVWIHNAPFEVKRIYSDHIVNNVLLDESGNDAILTLLQVPQGGTVPGTGTFEGAINPNVIKTMFLQNLEPEKINLYADIFGYVFTQNAVPWYRTDYSLADKEGVMQGFAFRRGDGPITDSLVGSFYEILKSKIPGAELTFLGDEIHVINFMGHDIADLKTKMEEVGREWSKKNDIDGGGGQFGTEGDYRTGDAEGAVRWTGDLYKSRIASAGGSGVLSGADRLRASALAAAKEFSEAVAPPGAKFQTKNIDSRFVVRINDINKRDVTPAVLAAASSESVSVRQLFPKDRLWLMPDAKAIMLELYEMHETRANRIVDKATEGADKWVTNGVFGGSLKAVRFHGMQMRGSLGFGDPDTFAIEIFNPLTPKVRELLSRSLGVRKKLLADVTDPSTGVNLGYAYGKGAEGLAALEAAAKKAYAPGAKLQTKPMVTTSAGEFPMEQDGFVFEGQWPGAPYYQYTNKDPNSPAYNATIMTDKPENLQAKIDDTVKKFTEGRGPKLQTRTPGPKGLTVNFTDAEVNALSEELLRGAFEKLSFEQSNDASMKKAQDLIKAGKMNLDTFLSHDPYTAWPDTATQVAAEMIAGGVFDYVKGRIADWKAGNITADEARQARMVGMGAIASWYLPQSEVGRMLQARQMAITPEGVPIRDLMAEQMKFETDLQEMIDKGMISPEEELEAIDKFYSVDQAMNFRKRVAKAKDVSVLNQLFYFSLLSNPVTQAANVIGNVGPLFFAIADQYVSEKNPFGATPKGGTAGMMAGLYHSILDAFILSGRAAYTGETSMGQDKFRNPRITGIESVDQARDAIKQIMADKTHPFHDPQSSEYATARRDVMQLHRKAFNPISGDRMARISSGAIDSDSPLARTLDVLGEMIDAPFKGLAAGDEFFKVLNHRMYVWKSAYEMATEKGLEEETFNEFVAEFVDDPPSTVEALAQEFAAKQTFTSELGPIAEVFQTWNREYPLFRVIVPFVTVIGNIAKYNMEHTPFAYAFRQVRADIKAGGKARDMALSKMAVGSSMMLAFAGLAAAGLITGGGPSDPKLKKLWSQKDSNGNVAWQEYSIKVGKEWISYKRIEPFATPIGVAADVIEILKFAPRVQIAEAMIGGAIAFTRNFTSKTYAQGISNFLEAITSGGGDTMQSNAARWGKSVLGMIVPGGIAQVARVTDPRVKDTHDWIDSLKARVPGLSQSLEPARNLKGDVMTVGMYESIPGKGLGMVNPLMYAGTTGDVVTKEILRNRVPLSMPSRRLGGGRNPDSAMFDESDTAIDLTPEQYGWFVQMAGNGLKDPKTGRGMWDTLTAIINGMEPVDPGGNGRPRLYYGSKNPDGTPVFSDGPEGGKAAIIGKVVHVYRDKVRDMIEKGDVFPEIRNEYITKSISKKINRAPQVGGVR